MSDLDRRTFLSQSTLAAVGVLLCGCAADSNPTAPPTIGSSIKVSDHPALANVDGIALVDLNGNRIAIVRTGAASFVALSRVCPHEGNQINPSTEGFLCTGHGARFNRTGTWIGGQATSSMRSYTTSYNATTDTLTIG